VINGPRLINDYTFRLVVRNINDVFLGRLDLDDAVLVADSLTVVALEIARGIRFIAKRLDGRDDVYLLCNDCLA